MKKLLSLVSLLGCLYYFFQYKQLKEKLHFDFIDIESEEDLLDRIGLFKDPEGNVMEK